MSDQQLYLAIGLPTVTALVGILVNIGYFVAINGRIGSLETRLDGRINSLESKVESRSNSLEAKLESRSISLESKFETKIDLLVGKIVDLDNRLSRMEERLKH